MSRSSLPAAAFDEAMRLLGTTTRDDMAIRRAAWVARCVGRGENTPLTAAALGALAATLQSSRARRDSVIFQAGQAARGVWLVQSGCIELSVGSGRRRTLVQLLRPGDVDGDIQLLLDMPMPYTARVLDDAVLLSLTPADFEHLLATSLPIARRWLSSVAQQLATSQGRLLPILGRSLTEQLAQLLLDEAVDGQVPLLQRTLGRDSRCAAPITEQDPQTARTGPTDQGALRSHRGHRRRWAVQARRMSARSVQSSATCAELGWERVSTTARSSLSRTYPEGRVRTASRADPTGSVGGTGSTGCPGRVSPADERKRNGGSRSAAPGRAPTGSGRRQPESRPRPPRPSWGPRVSDLPIGEYDFLSDCHSAALLSRAGSVDWLCFPRLVSPSAFARLLDDASGHSSIAAAATAGIRRAYLSDSLVLRSEFTTATGTLMLTDALALGARTTAGTRSALPGWSGARPTGSKGSATAGGWPPTSAPPCCPSPAAGHFTPKDHPEILAAAINDLLPPAGAQDAQLPNRPLETR